MKSLFFSNSLLITCEIIQRVTIQRHETFCCIYSIFVILCILKCSNDLNSFATKRANQMCTYHSSQFCATILNIYSYMHTRTHSRTHTYFKWINVLRRDRQNIVRSLIEANDRMHSAVIYDNFSWDLSSPAVFCCFVVENIVHRILYVCNFSINYMTFAVLSKSMRNGWTWRTHAKQMCVAFLFIYFFILILRLLHCTVHIYMLSPHLRVVWNTHTPCFY